MIYFKLFWLTMQPARYLVCLRTVRLCYEGMCCWSILQEKKRWSTAATSTVCSSTASNSASAQSKIMTLQEHIIDFFFFYSYHKLLRIWDSHSLSVNLFTDCWIFLWITWSSMLSSLSTVWLCVFSTEQQSWQFNATWERCCSLLHPPSHSKLTFPHSSEAC